MSYVPPPSVIIELATIDPKVSGTVSVIFHGTHRASVRAEGRGVVVGRFAYSLHVAVNKTSAGWVVAEGEHRCVWHNGNGASATTKHWQAPAPTILDRMMRAAVGAVQAAEQSDPTIRYRAEVVRATSEHDSAVSTVAKLRAELEDAEQAERDAASVLAYAELALASLLEIQP